MAEHRDMANADRIEQADGCDLDFTEDLTGDADLPPASGGVQQAARGVIHNDADGCDLDFTTGETTADAELPPATGGVASSSTR